MQSSKQSLDRECKKMQVAASGRFHSFLIYAKNLNIGHLVMPLGKFLFLFQKISKEQHYGKLNIVRKMKNMKDIV